MLPTEIYSGDTTIEYNTTATINKPEILEIDIDDAYFLIYNWPDDPSGANTSIPVTLHFDFMHQEKRYKIGTKTTFNDYAIEKYKRIHPSYYKNTYALLIKKAIQQSKKVIAEHLNTTTDNLILSKDIEKEIAKLYTSAAKKEHVDYV